MQPEVTDTTGYKAGVAALLALAGFFMFVHKPAPTYDNPKGEHWTLHVKGPEIMKGYEQKAPTDAVEAFGEPIKYAPAPPLAVEPVTAVAPVAPAASANSTSDAKKH